MIARQKTRSRKVRSAAVIRRRQWSKRVESATLGEDQARLRAARATFRRLDRVQQMRLAGEIAATRDRELSIAFKSVVSVAAGFKLSGRGRSRRIVRTPCVVFVVRAKWVSAKNRRDLLQKIPGELLAYATVGENRLLCAVPTDVVCETGFASARAQAPAGLEVGEYLGNATCGAIISRGAERSAVMVSCQHVLTPEISTTNPLPVAGAEVLLLDGSNRRLGRALRLGGRVRADGMPSFDVQFAAVDSVEAFQSAIRGLRLSPERPFIPDVTAFDAIATATFRILASPNNPDSAGSPPLSARFLRYIPPTMGVIYEFVSGAQLEERLVFHRRLMQFRILDGEACATGDSGSAIVLQNRDGRHSLVAMHIAGAEDDDGEPFSYGIPAWLLFNPAQYPLPSGTGISPLL